MGGSMNKRAFALVLVTAVAGVAAGAARAADADPTMQQIYAAAQGGHLDQAQTMIAQVLRDHPKSGKAHYVAAELDARQGHLAAARSELEQAESYDPGLPFAKPAAVAELKSELQGGSRSAPVYAAPAYGRPAGGLPWVPILLVIGVIAVIWMFARRRSTPVVYAGGGMGGEGRRRYQPPRHRRRVRRPGRREPVPPYVEWPRRYPNCRTVWRGRCRWNHRTPGRCRRMTAPRAWSV